MNHRLLRRLATVLTLALGLGGPIVPPGTGPASPDPCGPDGGITIDDFVMWDSPGGGFPEIPVRVRIPCDVARTVAYATYDMSAKAGEDYVGVQYDTFVFPAGQTRVTLRIQIIGDDTVEPEETFGIRLLDGAKFDDPVATVTLRDY